MTDVTLSEPSRPLAQRFGNLIGVASLHYEPVFAQEVRRVFTENPPDVIALELPPSATSELDWAAELWPHPVVSYSSPWFFPFIPGDSIVEAYRLARERGVTITFVDLDTDLSSSPPARPPEGNESPGDEILPVPGAELAPVFGQLYMDVMMTGVEVSEPPLPVHLAREAHMASQLASLMATHQQVLWVGGLAHWRRIVERLRTRDFTAPALPPPGPRNFRRMRLDSFALYHMTGRLISLVHAYAEASDTYDESDALRHLALEALPEAAQPDIVWRPDEELERSAPIDVARLLLYARNLALTTGPRERPNFRELLTAATAIIGGRYAGRLFMRAMELSSLPSESADQSTGQNDVLTWEVSEGLQGYRCGDEWIVAEPWLAPGIGNEIPLELRLSELRWLTRDRPYDHLPAAGKGEKVGWVMYPPDEEEYESFVEYALRRASVSDPGEVRSSPFMTGIRDGLDVRETIRHWKEGTIYVREEQRGQMNFTNGLIDWTSDSEYSDVLQGRIGGGWVDPSARHIGSASRQPDGTDITLQTTPYTAWIQCRELSLITLDAPTWGQGAEEDHDFYHRVILPLLAIQGTPEDNLYGWLEIMFRFCPGKPFVYYSRYVPSPRIHALATKHNVKLAHVPLHRLSQALLRKHHQFLFFELTRPQWDEMNRRLQVRKGPWQQTLPSSSR